MPDGTLPGIPAPYEMFDDDQPEERKRYYVDVILKRAVIESEHGMVIQDIPSRSPMENGSTRGALQHTIGLTNYQIPELIVPDMYPDAGGMILDSTVSTILDYFSRVEINDRPRWLSGVTIELSFGTGGGEDVTNVDVEFHPSRTRIEFADRYFGKRIPSMYVLVQGWPCRRCVDIRPTTKCTCLFWCRYRGCSQADPEDVAEFEANKQDPIKTDRNQ